jgi:hypothetical protein
MNKETLRMQMLSGIITEGEYKTKLEELNNTESKESLNENFVGIGAINNIFDREKSDYEIAFEHFIKGTSLNEEMEDKIEEGEDLSSPEAFQKFIDQIPNEKYFYIGDEEAGWAFNKEELPESYNWEAFDDEMDGDLVDYFYDDVFNNELKGKPGIEGENFNEFQDKDAEKDNVEYGYIGRRTTMLVDKIRDIITAYKKTHFA